MIGLVTAEARAWQAAEAEKRRKRQQGGTPAHAMADGHAEFHDEERERREAQKRHDVRHPGTGQFTTASAWPGTDAHPATADGVRLLQVGDRQAPVPVPRTTLADTFSADALGRLVHAGSVSVQHLSLATPPVPVSTTPRQLPFPIAPTGSTQ